MSYIFIYFFSLIYLCAKYLAIYPPSYDLCHPINIKSRKRPNDHGTELSSSARPESASGARQFLTVTYTTYTNYTTLNSTPIH